MALFRNLCIKLRGSLCDVRSYVSAQPFVLLELVKPGTRPKGGESMQNADKNSRFMNWKPHSDHNGMDGHYLTLLIHLLIETLWNRAIGFRLPPFMKPEPLIWIIADIFLNNLCEEGRIRFCILELVPGLLQYHLVLKNDAVPPIRLPDGKHGDDRRAGP